MEREERQIGASTVEREVGVREVGEQCDNPRVHDSTALCVGGSDESQNDKSLLHPVFHNFAKGS